MFQTRQIIRLETTRVVKMGSKILVSEDPAKQASARNKMSTEGVLAVVKGPRRESKAVFLGTMLMDQGMKKETHKPTVPGTSKPYENPSQMMKSQRKEDHIGFLPSMSVHIPPPVTLTQLNASLDALSLFFNIPQERKPGANGNCSTSLRT